jgi:hypothetical protein
MHKQVRTHGSNLSAHVEERTSCSVWFINQKPDIHTPLEEKHRNCTAMGIDSAPLETGGNEKRGQGSMVGTGGLNIAAICIVNH